MNPAIKKTVENIRKYVKVDDRDAYMIALNIGYLLSDFAVQMNKNKDLNLRGIDCADENTFGYDPNAT
jgi:hypothetical protein